MRTGKKNNKIYGSSIKDTNSINLVTGKKCKKRSKILLKLLPLKMGLGRVGKVFCLIFLSVPTLNTPESTHVDVISVIIFIHSCYNWVSVPHPHIGVVNMSRLLYLEAMYAMEWHASHNIAFELVSRVSREQDLGNHGNAS